VIATPPLEKVSPARGPRAPGAFVTLEELPLPACEMTPRECADCQCDLLGLMLPLPERDRRTP
jgi:hypothetical protein